jgi:hypothetical protein
MTSPAAPTDAYCSAVVLDNPAVAASAYIPGLASTLASAAIARILPRVLDIQTGSCVSSA